MTSGHEGGPPPDPASASDTPMYAFPPPPKRSPLSGGIARWGIPVATFLVGLILGGVSAGTGDDSDTTANAADPVPTVTVTVRGQSPQAEPAPTVTVTVETIATPPPAPPATSEPPAGGGGGTSGLTDDGWTVTSLKVSSTFGIASATARIVNNSGEDVEGAIFKITILDGDDVINSLSGAAQSVKDGETTTVDFIGDSDYKDGDYTYDFQVDGTF